MTTVLARAMDLAVLRYALRHGPACAAIMFVVRALLAAVAGAATGLVLGVLDDRLPAGSRVRALIVEPGVAFLSRAAGR